MAGFVVRSDSPLKKPEELKRKKFKISYSRPNSVTHILAILALRTIGIDPDDKNQVELVSTGGAPETWTAVKAGLVDVGWSVEPTISDIEGKGEGRVLWMSTDLVKEWTLQ